LAGALPSDACAASPTHSFRQSPAGVAAKVRCTRRVRTPGCLDAGSSSSSLSSSLPAAASLRSVPDEPSLASETLPFTRILFLSASGDGKFFPSLGTADTSN
jgi:hypothetical protein